MMAEVMQEIKSEKVSDDDEEEEIKFNIYINTDIFEPKEFQPEFHNCPICLSSFLSTQGLKSHLHNAHVREPSPPKDDTVQDEPPVLLEEYFDNYPPIEQQDEDEEFIYPAVKCEIIMEEEDQHLTEEQISFNHVVSKSVDEKPHHQEKGEISLNHFIKSEDTLPINPISNNNKVNRTPKPTNNYILCEQCHASFLSSQGLRSHLINCLQPKKYLDPPTPVKTSREPAKIKKTTMKEPKREPEDGLKYKKMIDLTPAQNDEPKIKVRGNCILCGLKFSKKKKTADLVCRDCEEFKVTLEEHEKTIPVISTRYYTRQAKLTHEQEARNHQPDVKHVPAPVKRKSGSTPTKKRKKRSKRN